ncbi:hypothetical protein Y1Q_0023807 [Alligator mississippiensis]|uniref:Uncharacterized protein n=1 Tax=Alligator mississippiensis TaxID=8496 RepID=A0A151MKG9_ALLMI|nr:hypothetical protein Y1Q_0023807 [Alligator mississippiensis]
MRRQKKRTRWSVTREMEKVKAYMANYEALRERNLSLEKELEAEVRESGRLRAQLQSVGVEKDHSEERVRSLKTLLEGSSAKEAVTNAENEQAQLQRHVLEQRIRALEAENKTLQATSNQMAAKGQDSGGSVEMEVANTATQTEAGLKAQTGECVEAMYEALQDQKRSLETETIQSSHVVC